MCNKFLTALEAGAFVCCTQHLWLAVDCMYWSPTKSWHNWRFAPVAVLGCTQHLWIAVDFRYWSTTKFWQNWRFTPVLGCKQHLWLAVDWDTDPQQNSNINGSLHLCLVVHSTCDSVDCRYRSTTKSWHLWWLGPLQGPQLRQWLHHWIEPRSTSKVSLLSQPFGFDCLSTMLQLLESVM